MSMAEVIKSIEREALREAQSQKLCGDISGGYLTQSQKFRGDISGAYLTKAPCISKDDSIPEELRENAEKELKDCFKE